MKRLLTALAICGAMTVSHQLSTAEPHQRAAVVMKKPRDNSVSTLLPKWLDGRVAVGTAPSGLSAWVSRYSGTSMGGSLAVWLSEPVIWSSWGCRAGSGGESTVMLPPSRCDLELQNGDAVTVTASDEASGLRVSVSNR